MTGRSKPAQNRNRLHTGAELHQWRTRMAISARQLGKLIGVTERSIHRAEKTGKLGTKITLAMELLLSRLEHGEIDFLSSLEAPSRRGRPRKSEPAIVSEDEVHYDTHWHGELRTGADLRRWRKQVGLYQKELAKLLSMTPQTLRQAEQSDSPNPRLIYGAELLRTKILSGELDIRMFTKGRVPRGRPKKIT